jgi:hypothetical protein
MVSDSRCLTLLYFWLPLMVGAGFGLRLGSLVLCLDWQGVNVLRVILLRGPSSLFVLPCVSAFRV